ncbi:hypothetical protein V2S84_02295, partial [Azotobacter chroococcum]|nr:hypothetical protein [Azotobacter chroococcum]
PRRALSFCFPGSRMRGALLSAPGCAAGPGRKSALSLSAVNRRDPTGGALIAACVSELKTDIQPSQGEHR